jgi:predicted CXXCH cytochrome family protein
MPFGMSVAFPSVKQSHSGLGRRAHRGKETIMRSGRIILGVFLLVALAAIAVAEQEAPLGNYFPSVGGTDVINGDCLVCHSVRSFSGFSGVHGAMSCLECHNPHDGTSSDRLDLELTGCKSCHDDHELGLSHPVGQGVVSPADNSTLTCVSACHSIHQPQHEKLLQTEKSQVCFKCHSDKF